MKELKSYLAPDLEQMVFVTEQGFVQSVTGGSSNEEFEEGNNGEPIW